MKTLISLVGLVAVFTGLLVAGLTDVHISIADSSLAPTVTTNNATNVEETTATLNGMVSDDGGEACQYRFEYDTDSGEPYAYNTTWAGSNTSGQSFTESVSNLTKGTEYYFRAQAKNSAGIGSGSEQSLLTKPDAPTDFTAISVGPDRIDLSWTKGDGAQKTKVMRKQGGYPTDKDDGTQVYFHTGSWTWNMGLTHNTTYYYRAWSYVEGSEQWSDDYAEAWATTGGVVVTVSIDAPDGVTEGRNFTASVNITQVTDFDSYQFWVGYDSNVIEVTDVTSGLIDSTTVPIDSWEFSPPGTISLEGDIPGDAGVTGSGYLAEIHFHVVGSPGDSSNIDLFYGHLSDNAGSWIPGVDWLGDSVQVNVAVIVSIGAPAEVAHCTNFTAGANVTEVTRFCGDQFEVSYDPGVIGVIDVTDGLIDSTTVDVDWGFWPPGTNGTIRVIGELPLELTETGINGTGYLAEIHFHVIASGCNTSNITFSNGKLFNNLGNWITPVTWVDGSVHVAACIPGDANEDGDVDIGDVIKVRRIILTLDPPTPCADVNGDGFIDVGDVIKTKRIILGLD